MKEINKANRMLNSLANEFSSNKSIEVINSTKFLPLSKDQTDSLASELKNNGFGDYIDLINEYISMPVLFSTAWEYNLDGKFEMGGVISLHNISIVLLDDKYKLVIHDSMGAINKKDISHFKYFDKTISNGESFGAVITLNNELRQLVTGVYMDGIFYKMKLNINNYIKYLGLTKGFNYWQFLFCDGLSDELKLDLKENYFKRMLKDLPILFPEHDYTELRNAFSNF